MLRNVKRWLIGLPLRTAQHRHERLSNPVALAIFASDALSSTAYATEEILMVLTLAGSLAIGYAGPIAVGISALIAIVTLSYRNLIHAYPAGGGAFSVARENLGIMSGNIAGASLLIDYVLTVAVSTAAGIAAVTSAFPALHDYRIALCIGAVTLVTLGNLRGVRESGALFAIPSFIFIFSFLALLGWGAYRHLNGEIVPLNYTTEHLKIAHEGEKALGGITLFLLLRAFSSGCTALTGLEAISNGTAAFRKPEHRNAATVMGWMSIILATLFVGLSFLAIQYHVLPYNIHQENYQTVVSQIARAVSGGTGFFYYLIQGATMVILLLAANTAFAGFPRLASILAQQGYLPRQFGTLGDKLVFTNGIVILAFTSIILLVVFNGDTHALIPLYAVGVFLGFTLAQAGMVVKQLREKGEGWRWGVTISALGGTLTGVVLLVISVTKFTHGAWLVFIFIPILVRMFYLIHSHYFHVAEQLTLEGQTPPRTGYQTVQHTVIVPVSGVHQAVVRALQYAQSLAADDVRAVYVNLNPETTHKLEERWPVWGLDVPLVILDSHYRSIVEPLLKYVDLVQSEPGNDFVTIVLPEFVTRKWWHAALHNQTALMIRSILAFRKGVVVTSVRWHLKE